jgi:uncharacterized protein (TIGR01777 family)
MGNSMNSTFKKIVLAGGSGYIGKVLANYFKDNSDEIVVLSRNLSSTKGKIRTVKWDAKNTGSWISELEGADALINLTGKSVNCRYNEKNKREILESRKNATNILGYAINQLQNPPKTWIQFASATIYRHAMDHSMDEETGEFGDGFSVDVCKNWEQTFWNQQTAQTRKVLLRVSIVFGKTDGVFLRLLNLVRFGLGGKQGSGKQMVSWIHDKDLSRITEWLLRRPEITGTFNAAAPNPISNETLMNTIRKEYAAVIGFNAPAWLLKIGAVIIGTETELILKSRWVIPKRLEEHGFDFEFKTIEKAVHNILHE